MLQPGRFDVLIYLGVSEDEDSRQKILKAQTRKMNLGCTIEEIEKIMPKGYTGADVFNYVSSAFKKAMVEMKERIREEVKKEIGDGLLDRKEVREYIKDQESRGIDLMGFTVDLKHFEAF